VPLFPALFRPLLLTAAALLPLAASAQVSWSRQIQPIFEHKCVACHACYESPCQLNLGSADGLNRGGTQALVYDGARTRPSAPTRLFIDANSPADWRRKGFYAVAGNDGRGGQAKLLAHMLALGRDNGFVAGERLPEDLVLGVTRQNTCPSDDKGFEKYRRKHPREGMPLAVTGLSDNEYALINQWLKEGARTDNALVRHARPEEQVQLQQWEAFLNQRGPRARLMARWLYEHLFLAHLYFSDLPDSQFFELVRSRTPPGKPIRVIATAAPNDDPGGAVYYRLRPVQGVIVLKTHIIFPLSPALLTRTRQQFLDPAWKPGATPGYGEAARANPFTTFAALPARGRYQFMLDHAEYFVRTFIRGPVCHGQIATDVIRDHFWTVFQTPDSDLYITDPVHRAQASPLLGLAGQKDGLLDLAPEWARFKRDRNLYQRLRSAAYAAAEPRGASLDEVWNGDGDNRNALLTIFRHFDSAAVRQGLIGDIPQTFWLMDYPLFERTYYGLVANFNVFGTVSHQAQTRLYFDLIRNGAEINFLRLLPPKVRRTVYDDWYQGSGKLKVWLDYGEPDTGAPSREAYATANPHDELAARLLTRFAAVNARPDPINRCEAGSDCSRPEAPEFARIADRALARLAAKPAAKLPVVKLMPELTLLRVRDGQGRREVYSLIRNRAHSNVAFMLGEDWRYQPEKDTLTVFPGVQGSYPNFAFDVPLDELERFVAALRLAATPEEFQTVAARWGVRRTRADFWEVFHDFTAYMRETEPREAGVLDMNRWENF
jgi:hypothetical protein